MRKIIAFITCLVMSFAFLSCFPVPVSAQNVQGWFTKSLYLNGIGTHANVPNINRAGAGIWGTDTTFYLNLSTPNYSVSWWSVSCFSTTVATGTGAYFKVGGMYDGTSSVTKVATTVNIAPDSTSMSNYGCTSGTTPLYKWTFSSSGYATFKGNGFPFPYLTLTIAKGNNVTTATCHYYVERKFIGK
jgi:hypothetical protein